MKYFKDATGQVYAYEADGTQDEWIQPGLMPLSAAEVDAHCNPPVTPEAEYAAWKAERAKRVKAIVVTTANGNLFDGDEVSQGRMARAIIALQATPDVTTTPWVMSTNQTIQVTVAELSEALALAGQRQTELWIKP